MWSLSLSKCGQTFVINPTNKTVSDETKQLIDQLLLERIYLRGIARVTGVSWSWLQNYVDPFGFPQGGLLFFLRR